MKQICFAYAKYAAKRKRTRRDLFLSELEKVVPWKGDRVGRAAIFKRRRGSSAYPLMAMLQVHLIHNRFGYSDPAMDEMLYETNILR